MEREATRPDQDGDQRRHQIAAALEAIDSDPLAYDRLVELLYPELRRLARRQLRRLRPGDTLDTTSLVNEAYLKMVGDGRYADLSHFLAATATAMRHILLNAAERRLAEKRGAGRAAITLEEWIVPESPGLALEEIVAVGRALDGLADFEPRLRGVVECRFFAGYTEAQTAEALSISERTVRRDWRRARAWLRREMT
ncbi:MAG: ECF-type sigma factor [Acidobacteriota bacterium]|nr:ECF-type sigma factor [Acidobacteriota bacterium]